MKKKGKENAYTCIGRKDKRISGTNIKIHVHAHYLSIYTGQVGAPYIKVPFRNQVVDGDEHSGIECDLLQDLKR